MGSTRFGIRYRLSLVLLLSALNSIALAALAIISVSAVIESPSPEVVGAVRNMQSLVDLAHDNALSGNLKDPAQVRRIEQALDSAAPALDPVRGRLPALDADLESYVAANRAWVAASSARPAADPDQDPLLAQRLAELRLAHRHLSGSAQLAISYERPLWVEQAVPLLPWGLAWVLFVGGVTVVAAWSLRTQLSQPLVALADAAGHLARGNLRVRIPRYGDIPEIGVLADAMRAARDSVLHLLAEQDARTVREKAVFQHMSDGVMLCDEAGVVLQLNPRAEQLLWQLVPTGLEPRTGHSVHRLVREVNQEVLAAGRAQTFEVHRVAPGQEDSRGNRVFVEVGLRPIPATSSAPGSWVIVLHDVTRDRELDAMQREFLSVVTHELKTPLTAIEGYARLLLKGRAGSLSERQTVFVQTISDQSSVLKAMVQNLLDTSRLEGGALPIHRQEIELSPTMRELADTWEGSATSREISLNLETRDLRGVVLNLDPFRLQQVVGNLVSNALKFTERGGRITLRAYPSGTTAVIEVEDSGRGIPADKQARVFDKFFQVARGDTRVAGGAGLGLFICKQLVDAMDGTITVRSDEGVGSCFTIRFPIVRADEVSIPLQGEE